MENELAGHLGVSRPSLREALQRLNAEAGLISARLGAPSCTSRPATRPTSS